MPSIAVLENAYTETDLLLGWLQGPRVAPVWQVPAMATPNSGYAVLPSCLRGRSHQLVGSRISRIAPHLRGCCSCQHRVTSRKAMCPSCPVWCPCVEGEQPAMSLGCTERSRDVACGGLEPLTLAMSWLAVLGERLVALSPTWTVCLSSSRSCRVLLLPPASPSLGHRSLSQPAPALLSVAEGQQ